jgi:alpha,alpha-trehalase
MVMSSTPIADHALLSDCHSAALVSREGSVEWLCFPRFDSPSVFGRLLDDEAGHWSIRPAANFRVTRRYLDQTMVLETTFATAAGSVTVVDALALGADERGHDLGRNAPSLLIRQVVGVTGQVELGMEYVPRTEYGLIWPLLSQVDGGIAGRGGPDITVLSAPVDLQIRAGAVVGRFSVAAGERVAFGLHYGQLGGRVPQVWPQGELARRLGDTLAGWRSWSEIHQSYAGPWRELVHTSGRVLQALTFYPTGAIVAAPTTSLPETPGGACNWDYRFSWVRDACLTMDALWVAACADEAAKFFAFLSTAAATSLHRGADLQIMFGVGGERDLSERVLPHLAGWRDSAPVRVGNGACNQRQVDVYGELLAAVGRLRDQIGELDPATRAFLVAVADTAARRWAGKDQGIWEIRGAEQDFVYSKVMCWVALDRAIALAGSSAPRTRCRAGSGPETTSTPRCSSTAGARGLALSRTISAPTTSTPPAHDADRRVSARRRPPRAGHHRRHRRAPHRRTRPGLPLRHAQRSRRPGRPGGHLRAVHLLAGPGPGPGRPARAGTARLRACHHLPQRRRPARRGSRPGHR